PYSQQRRLITVGGQQAYPQLAEKLNRKFIEAASGSGSNANYQGLVIEKNQDGILQLFNWLEQKIERISYQHKALTLQELQAVWRGDCTEFALMGYYALKNSGFKNVVPVVGFYFPEGSNRIVDQSKYHAWLLVEDNGQWLVVDPLFKKIQQPNAEYIVIDAMQEGQNEMMILSSFTGIRLE
ncbi:MAG: transglutaminase domain-containing protein, partial [Venatoribacter sp.]